MRARAVLGAVTALVVVSGTHPSGAAEPTVVRSAAGLTSSLGVNVHLAYGDTSYGDAARVGQLLEGLDVTHVRDGVRPGNTRASDAARLLNKRGVRFDWIVGDPAGRNGTGSLQQELAELEGPLAGTFDLLEGPNEYDCSGRSDWLRQLKEYQGQLTDALDARPGLSGFPLLGPSFCRAASAKAYGRAVRPRNIGNFHPYSGGAAPEAALDDGFFSVRGDTGVQAAVATEAGYHNAVQGESNSQVAVTEAQAAGLVLRTFLEAYRLGIPRTYLYELLDEKADPGLTNQEQHFGLVREDGSVKPAYRALADLIALTRATVPSSQTLRPALDSTASGLRSLVLARGAGVFDVVAWRDSAVTASCQSSAVPVTLRLPSSYQMSVAMPTRGRSWTALGAGRGRRLLLCNEPAVVRLTPVR